MKNNSSLLAHLFREKSMSPDRPRKFDPRKLRRSETPEPEPEVAVKEAPRLKNEHLFQVEQSTSLFVSMHD